MKIELASGLPGQADQDGLSPLAVCFLSRTSILGQIGPSHARADSHCREDPLPPELAPGHSLILPKSLLRGNKELVLSPQAQSSSDHSLA